MAVLEVDVKTNGIKVFKDLQNENAKLIKTSENLKKKIQELDKTSKDYEKTKETLTKKLKSNAEAIEDNNKRLEEQVFKLKKNSDSTQKATSTKEKATTQEKKFEKTLGQANTAINKQSDSMQSFTSVAKTAFAVLAGYVVIDSLTTSVVNLGKAFLSTADEMSLITSRVKLATNGIDELNEVQRELLNVSNNARVALQGTVTLYGQLASSTQQLGLSSEYLLGVTDTISKTLTISGASALSAEAALIQLSQGLGAGALRGEELNSVIEQTPRLARAIADGMGVSIGQLKQLGSEGALTTQKVLEALRSQASVVSEEFANVAVTVKSGYQVLQNNIDSTIAKLDQQNKITETIGNAFVALGSTMETAIGGAFEELTGDSKNFGEFVMTAISGAISGLGGLYDTLETVGEAFGLLKATAGSAFWGIQTATATLSRWIQESFEKSFNAITDGFEAVVNSSINGLNRLIELANNIPGVNIGTIGTISFDRIDLDIESLLEREAFVKNNFEQSVADMGKYYEQLADVGTTGRDLAEEINKGFTGKFAELLENMENTTDISNNKVQIAPVIDSVATGTTEPIVIKDDSTLDLVNPFEDTINEALTNANTAIEELNDTTSNTVEEVKELNDTYEVVTDSTKDYNSTLDNTTDITKQATKAVEEFNFQFKESFLNTLTNTSDKLRSVLQSQNEFNKASFAQAFKNVKELEQQVIEFPANAEIADKFTNAYNTFIDSATNALDPSEFRTREDFLFAQARIGSEVSNLQDTASIASEVTTGLELYLETLNTALTDGLLTDEEKSVLGGIATSINTNNDKLLGKNSALDKSVVAVGTTVGAQTYYDNSPFTSENGLKVDNKVADTSDLMKDNTFVSPYSSVKLQDKTGTTINPYTGSDINATVNTVDVSTLATSKDLGIVNGSVSGTSGLTQSINNATTAVSGTDGLESSIDIVNSKIAGSGDTTTEKAILAVNSSLGAVNSNLSGSTTSVDSKIGDVIGSLGVVNTSIGANKDSLNSSIGITKTSMDNVNTSISGDNGVNSSIGKVDFSLLKLDEKISGRRNSLIFSLDEMKSHIDGPRNSVGISLQEMRNALGSTTTTIEAPQNSVISALKGVNTALGGDSTQEATNSIKSVLSAFGANNGGIKLSGLTSGTNALSVATGLDVSELSTISTNTLSQATELGSVSSNTLATSQGIAKIGKVPIGTAQTVKTPIYEYGQVRQYDSQGRFTGYQTQITGVLGYKDEVKYWDGSKYKFDQGGFTGMGRGMPDSSGFKQAGVVHENEWVAPKWMLDKYPDLMGAMEDIRVRGFATGGMTTNNSTTSTIINKNFGNNVDMKKLEGYNIAIVSQLQGLNRLVRSVVDGGNTFGVRLEDV